MQAIIIDQERKLMLLSSESHQLKLYDLQNIRFHY